MASSILSDLEWSMALPWGPEGIRFHRVLIAPWGSPAWPGPRIPHHSWSHRSLPQPGHRRAGLQFLTALPGHGPHAAGPFLGPTSWPWCSHSLSPGKCLVLGPPQSPCCMLLAGVRRGTVPGPVPQGLQPPLHPAWSPLTAGMVWNTPGVPH